MSARRVAALLVAATALIAFAIWLSSRRHLERDLASGDLVLPGLEHAVNSVTSVSLRRGDETHTSLSRDKDGRGWSVSERGWPADVDKLRKLLLDLGALNIVEEKTRLAANYPALGVEDVSSPKAAGTLVEVVAPARRWALIVGKSSSGKSGYVRVAGTPQSLLAAPLLAVDADPKGWLDRTLIDISSERVREIDQQPAQGPAYSAVRDKALDDKKQQISFTVSPLPKGRQLSSPEAANPLAGALSALQLDDVRKAASAADAQVSRATFQTFDGLTIELAGRKDGPHSLVAISVRSTAPATAAEAQKLATRLAGWEFELPDYRYSSLFTPLDQLLKLPEPLKKASPAAKGKKLAPAPSR